MVPTPLETMVPKITLTLREFAFFLGRLHTFEKTNMSHLCGEKH